MAAAVISCGVVIRTVPAQDLNGDGMINSADCQAFIDMLGSGTATSRSDLDVNGDGYHPAYKVYDGWYFDLVYENSIFPDMDPHDNEWTTFTTIADVHTKPLDDTGPALVLHAATGYINLMTVAVEIDSCISLFVGPVGSYYDVTTSADSPRRLNDDDWEKAILNMDPELVPLVKRPAWTAGFLY